MKFECFDVVVIGAGAAGLMCASVASKKGRRVKLLEHGKRPGRKILISGGGRCNFTNYYIEPSKYLSKNKHFCKSALSQYTQWDFISLVESYGISFHEKKLGQLFCNGSAKEIVKMLLDECSKANVACSFETSVDSIEKKDDNNFIVKTNFATYQCKSLIIATGGLSMPKLGATPFAWKIAEQFNIPLERPRAGLVPFTLHEEDKEYFSSLSGVSMPCGVSSESKSQSFQEDLLFTHRGLSGPAMLQISSYWQPGESIAIDLLPEVDLKNWLRQQIENSPKQELKTALSQILSKRFVETLIKKKVFKNSLLVQLTEKSINTLCESLYNYEIYPVGTEGYRTAEVTLGGVSTDALSSKTMMVKEHPGLFFIGEAVDVTGWLGGYNFQWAWSSGWVAAQHV